MNDNNYPDSTSMESTSVDHSDNTAVGGGASDANTTGISNDPVGQPSPTLLYKILRIRFLRWTTQRGCHYPRLDLPFRWSI